MSVDQLKDWETWGKFAKWIYEMIKLRIRNSCGDKCSIAALQVASECRAHVLRMSDDTLTQICDVNKIHWLTIINRHFPFDELVAID